MPVTTIGESSQVSDKQNADICKAQWPEQAALPQTTSDIYRTHVFAWYNLVGSCAAALGAVSGGALAQALQHAGSTPLASYRVMLLGYAGLGVVLGLLFTRVSPAVEVPVSVTAPTTSVLGLHRSRRVG